MDQAVLVRRNLEHLLRSTSLALSVDEALRQAPDILLTVSTQAASALSQLSINSVFDLAAGQIFAEAKLVVAAANEAGPMGKLGGPPSDVLEMPQTLVAIEQSELAELDIQFLKGIGTTRVDAIKAGLDVSTIRELSEWPGHLAAREFLMESLGVSKEFEEQEEIDTEALRPRLGQYPTERCFYESLVMLDYPKPIAGLKSLDGPVSVASLLTPISNTKPAVGALLTYSQSWYSQGFTLGQLLHTLALAPGEATRIAVIDWSRKSGVSSSESISEGDQLSNTMTHGRSVSEVQSAVARETQSGGSSSTTSTSSDSLGVAGGALPLPNVLVGGSYEQSSGSSTTGSTSWSQGSREMLASMSQNINDRTEQHAMAARNRRATAVREVSQSEHESVSTRILANYNHMHTLNISYFEAVQLYRVVTELRKAERVLFVPLALIDFKDQNIVDRFRGSLMRGALTRKVRDALQLGDRRVQIVPTSYGLPRIRSQMSATELASFGAWQTTRGKGDGPPRACPFTVWDEASMAKAAEDLGTSIFGDRPHTVSVPEGCILLGIDFSRGFVKVEISKRKAGKIEVSATAGSNVCDLTEEQQLPVSDLASIFVDFFEFEGEKLLSLVDHYLTLRLQYRGTSFSLNVPLNGDVSAMGRKVLEFSASQPGSVDIEKHLVSNAEHYTRAVYQSFGAAEFSTLLSGYTWEGQPLLSQIEPRPYAVSGPYAIFRAPAEIETTDVAEPTPSEPTPAPGPSKPTPGKPAPRGTNFAGVPAIGPRMSPSFAANLASAASVQPVIRADLVMDYHSEREVVGFRTLSTWGKLLADKGIKFGQRHERLIPMATGGVFAEAILGRANCAEKLDMTRFWNWQDSPIPLTPPEISPVATGSRAMAEDLTPGQLGTSLIQMQAPTQLPNPTGVGSILSAIQAGNMFRDMAGLAGTQANNAAALQGSFDATTAAGQIASQNMKTYADFATSMAAMAMGVPSPGGISGDGAKVNLGRDMDRRRTYGPASDPTSPTNGSGTRPVVEELLNGSSGNGAINSNGGGPLMASLGGGFEEQFALTANHGRPWSYLQQIQPPPQPSSAPAAVIWPTPVTGPAVADLLMLLTTPDTSPKYSPSPALAQLGQLVGSDGNTPLQGRQNAQVLIALSATDVSEGSREGRQYGRLRIDSLFKTEDCTYLEIPTLTRLFADAHPLRVPQSISSPTQAEYYATALGQTPGPTEILIYVFRDYLKTIGVGDNIVVPAGRWFTWLLVAVSTATTPQTPPIKPANVVLQGITAYVQNTLRAP